MSRPPRRSILGARNRPPTPINIAALKLGPQSTSGRNLTAARLCALYFRIQNARDLLRQPAELAKLVINLWEAWEGDDWFRLGARCRPAQISDGRHRARKGDAVAFSAQCAAR